MPPLYRCARSRSRGRAGAGARGSQTCSNIFSLPEIELIPGLFGSNVSAKRRMTAG